MASDDHPSAGGLTQDLEAAELQFQQAIHLFQEMIRKIRSGQDISSVEAERVSKTLFIATNTLLTYKVRIHDERKRNESVRSGGALDLDDARLKVGRLLDRLRASRAPGAVPE